MSDRITKNPPFKLNKLNISKTTVSRALSGKGRISDSTRKRVMAYASNVNYKPSAIAKSLATSKTMNIGFVMPNEEKKPGEY